MITVISGTNRKESIARHVAEEYTRILREETTEEVKLLLLEDIPHDWFYPEMYEVAHQAPSLARIQDEYLIPATKFVFIVSEYNGGYPGVLKLFIDAVSIREYAATFDEKKAGLIGVASGRAGALRALDQLTHVLLHVGTLVMPGKLPISSIKERVSSGGEIVDPVTLTALRVQAQEMVAF